MPESSPGGVAARPRGTRSRAGNAMERTRANVLAAAARCVAKYGSRRTTMGDIATTSGVAKATIYNHFRTKDDVYVALVDAEVRGLGDRCVARISADPDALAAT